MFRQFLLAFATTAALVAPSLADDAQLARIATMPIPELDAFTATVAASVGKDTLGLRSAAQANNCLDLRRAANSFALGYTYLAAVRDTAEKLEDKDAPLLRAKAVQARVITFASRVRAEEWLNQRCRSFTVPAADADDPRYAAPPKVANAEYTQAIVEARQTAETNLAIAVAAGNSRQCGPAIAAGQNIALLVPYVSKLLTDTAKRPEVLGPRASRRGLEASRRQLVAALDTLQAEFGGKCARGMPTPTPETTPDAVE